MNDVVKVEPDRKTDNVDRQADRGKHAAGALPRDAAPTSVLIAALE